MITDLMKKGTVVLACNALWMIEMNLKTKQVL